MAHKFAPVTDPAEIAELEKIDGELGKPFPFKPNGHLWVDAEELREWRLARDQIRQPNNG